MTDRDRGMLAIGAVTAGVGALLWLCTRGRSAALGAPGDDWWRRPMRYEHKLCHRTKHEALMAMRDANRATIDAWGGLDASGPPSEFDSINARYGLKGPKAVRTIAQALWVAMPPRPPYCLDEIDLDALNATAPGAKGNGFQLPDWAIDEIAQKEWERHYALPED